MSELVNRSLLFLPNHPAHKRLRRHRLYLTDNLPKTGLPLTPKPHAQIKEWVSGPIFKGKFNPEQPGLPRTAGNVGLVATMAIEFLGRAPQVSMGTEGNGTWININK